MTASPVQVLDVLDARPLRARHVFLLGVGEGQFPPRFSDSAVLGEAQRAAWANRGVLLDSRGDLATREMLLFYLAVSRGDESLTVSCLEPEGGGLGASHFLESLLERMAGADKPPCHRVRAGWPTPTSPDGRIDESQIVSVREALLAATAGVFSRDFQGGQGALAWSARNAREPLTRAAMGLFARDRRWRRGQPDAFDGRLDRADLLADLATQFGPEHVHSAGGLSLMARCPWSFFAKYVLALEPLSQPERQLEAQSRGIFVHEVLFQAMSALAGPGGGVRLSAVSQEQCDAALAQAVADQAARVESLRPRYPALWRIQLDQMGRELRDFLRSQRAAALPGLCLHFELAFGPDVGGEGGRDLASTDQPVTIDTPAGPVRLHGRIDRVDRVDLGEQAGLMVVDYKTGALPSEADILTGRNLQLTLYAEAVARLFGADALGGVFYHVGATGPACRFFAAVKPGKNGFTIRDSYDAQRERLLALTGELVEHARAGQFLLPREEQCSSWCPYKRICQFSPARAAVKGGADAL
jgi:ATP-dependent helicase/nuclease subunit B